MPASNYDEWRALAEAHLVELERQWSKHKDMARRLDGEIQDLRRVMGNGASGGTAWTLHDLPS